jgi:hypothetical protein
MGLVRTVAVVFGAIYVLAGLAGFVIAQDDMIFGLFEVNALHNIVHILLGAILLYGSTSTSAAIMATRGVGAVLLLLGILGIPFPEGFDIVPLGGNDIWLHLVTGAILLAAGFMGESAETSAA